MAPTTIEAEPALSMGGATGQINPRPPAEDRRLPPSSADRVELLLGEPARDNRHWYAKSGSALAGQEGDQRPRPLRAGPGRKHQDRDAGLLVDQGEQLVLPAPFSDIDDGHRAGNRRDLFTQLV